MIAQVGLRSVWDPGQALLLSESTGTTGSSGILDRLTSVGEASAETFTLRSPKAGYFNKNCYNLSQFFDSGKSILLIICNLSR
jgi:hypothetical protein